MVYNLFLNDNFLKNPLMNPFLTSWQHAQTQQLQLMISQYQFWQRLGMQTLLASQQFWLPNTSVRFGFSHLLPNTPLTTSVKPFIDPLLSSVAIPTTQPSANRIHDVLPVEQPNPSTVTVAKTKTENVEITLPEKNAVDTKKPLSNSAISPAKTPRKVTETLKKPVITADKAKPKPVVAQKDSQPTAEPKVAEPIAANSVILPTVVKQTLASVQAPADVAKVKKLAVDINHATQAQLLKLNGINSKKAQDIIAYREKNQGFQDINELAKVKGIGQSTVDKNRDALTLTSKK